MSKHIENRDLIIEKLREEIIGPAPNGAELDLTKALVFENFSDAYQPYKQIGGEEIIQRDAPLNRYGAGVLFPSGNTETEIFEDENQPDLFGEEDENQPTENVLTAEAEKTLAEFAENTPVFDEETDFDLSSANRFLPSTIGVSFLAELPKDARIIVEANGGRYRKLPIVIADKPRIWWRRESVSITMEFAAPEFSAGKTGKLSSVSSEKTNADELDLQIELFARPRVEENQWLLTVCFINRTQPGELSRDEASVFQAGLTARIVSENSERQILPYPQAEYTRQDAEEDSIALLYRDVQTFAVGHGCAADWETEAVRDNRIDAVSAECFPVCEVPSITPDIKQADGSSLEISMAKLAGIVEGADALDDLERLVGAYENWIDEKRAEIIELDAKYYPAANSHLDECEKCASRMRDGLDFIKNDARAGTAFRLANHAVLIQQYRSKSDLRRLNFDEKTKRLEFSANVEKFDLTDGKFGNWRAFQIAFLLMSVCSAVEADAPDREIVELIWFPTGGGKTEAYLGLTAFSLFMRRLQNPEDTGTHVLMRYTLRLLTAQQFQRACSLICAMEYLRGENPDQLGEGEFSIALWLGNQVTPGSRQQAKEVLKRLNKNPEYAENMFILSRCPWCAAQIGVLANRAAKSPKVAGYEESFGTVIFKCSDRNCEFSSGLPVFVVDEDIYENRPSLVIGTVDKFAMLAWKPEARALFGFDDDGNRTASPPGLIIQDELHLISGPLGSMVGLYEAVIEELCTDRRENRTIRPKIISSTATTRSYAEQIKALYARTSVQLFPPPGLDVGDSFFSRYARDEKTGKLLPGRKFVGINAPGLGSLQNAEVRAYTALLQAPFELSATERDPWWTLLVFFNNLRMLGNTISLFQANIPAYFISYRNRTKQERIRKIFQLLELTGRLKSDEVPAAITKLEVKTTDSEKYPVDVCLASNIIEVGVDIDRLSLMAVIGPPKTTAQYIQVTGRVGRRWRERPGLVATLYSPMKPRDRSHFEHFRSYHERLYAQVEPTSVTPFSAPALERALHAVMTAFVRQTGAKDKIENPFPFPAEILKNLRERILPRVEVIDDKAVKTFEQLFDRRAREWQKWQREKWGGVMGNNTEDALLRTAGNWVRPEDEAVSWATPTSMRNVDAQSEIKITQLYNLLTDEEKGETKI